MSKFLDWVESELGTMASVSFIALFVMGAGAAIVALFTLAGIWTLWFLIAAACLYGPARLALHLITRRTK